MPELDDALDTLRTSVITSLATPLGTTTGLVFGPGNVPQYMATWKYGLNAPVSTDDIPAATTLDLDTFIAGADDGSIITVSGTATIDTITLADGLSRILEFLVGGSVLTDTGGNLIIAGGEIKVVEGMKVQVIARGASVECFPLTDLLTRTTAQSILSSTVIATDVGTKQTLYTVPTGFRFVLVRIIFRDATADVSSYGLDQTIGFNAGADNLGAVDWTVHTTANIASMVTVNSTPIATAAETLGIILTDTSITGESVTADVFGYLI